MNKSSSQKQKKVRTENELRHFGRQWALHFGNGTLGNGQAVWTKFRPRGRRYNQLDNQQRNITTGGLGIAQCAPRRGQNMQSNAPDCEKGRVLQH